MKMVMKGDNISRSALIRQIEIDADGSPGWYGDTWQFIKTIAKMPSTDRKGQWIFEERKRLDDETDEGPVYRVEKRWKCSVCGHDKGFGGKPSDKFCSECGADMRGEQND